MVWRSEIRTYEWVKVCLHLFDGQKPNSAGVIVAVTVVLTMCEIAVAYYPTALEPHELEEIYQDGAPLSEVVSGGSIVKTADRLDRLELEVLDARASLSRQQAGVQQEVLDLQSASALTMKGAIAGKTLCSCILVVGVRAVFLNTALQRA